MGINGPWITKSYLEMILERKGYEMKILDGSSKLTYVNMYEWA